MDSKAQLTVDIIAKVAERKISIVNAAKLLNKSRRTIERYLQKYQKVGIQFVVHQNSGKSPANKISDAVKRAVQALIKEKYFDVNLAHLRELLDDNEQIQVKRETLRSWAHEIHHVKRAKRRRTQALCSVCPPRPSRHRYLHKGVPPRFQSGGGGGAACGSIQNELWVEQDVVESRIYDQINQFITRHDYHPCDG